MKSRNNNFGKFEIEIWETIGNFEIELNETEKQLGYFEIELSETEKQPWANKWSFLSWLNIF